ncbi:MULTISPECIES: D-alanyl-lipoteichoic acid biosynthesis protein DltB [unclassified Lacticaseibacillus]|uniref:D-alanyl-lipoteichoic acid biosynthesis protein DltB n=1 Tax=unclassified Lacticaseibacillus TaxID=2759744 RepID=UPI0019432121|nr:MULTISPECIES: D-alanyl-lipoteichoic acid biosynthesis protein DltB [unclassified Lacticaseibacillus]
MLNLQPYADPQYFLLLMLGLLPVMIGLYHGRRFKTYETLISLLFIILMFTGAKWQQGLALIGYIFWQLVIVFSYLRYRKHHNQTGVFVLTVLLSILPLVVVKVTPAVALHPSLLGFLGISYLTFKAVQVIMELRDGTMKDVKLMPFLRFMLFMPVISSGPIDRYRRFQKDYDNVPKRDLYLSMLSRAVWYLFLGFFYKYMLGYLFGTVLLPRIEFSALAARHMYWLGLSPALIGVAFVYSMYLFFDFAGYSLFAVATSLVMGIDTPMNFNRPFQAHNIKDFWNRWHMTLSFWFRDFIFMRVTFFIMKHKLIKNPIRVSQVAYLINFLIMGFWHGVTWYYIVYGLFHACAIIINDIWLRFKKKHRKQLPHNRWTEALAIATTFCVVCFSFLIFSGFLNTLWFK